MGKIYRNGVVYGGTTDVAGNIRYDNTGTGLGSVTVQNAITELKELADGATTQMTALPVASAANVNKIYQYTGATNANYINGMFYKCVYDTNVNPAVYKWQIIDTSTSSADEVTYDNTNSGLTAANVQAAIDELNANDVGKKKYVNNVLKGEVFNSSSNDATGLNSHAEGMGVTASGDISHAEGNSTTASSTAAHAEGSVTTASGYGSHAEGSNTTASNEGSHAEGGGTAASGRYSHAEGCDTEASGKYSHAGGNNTRATQEAMTAIGKYNSPKTGDLFNIGNGTGSSARSNIVEVDTTSLNVNGDIKQNGTIIDFSGSDVGKKEYVNNELKGEIFNSYSGNDKNIASGQYSHAEGQLTAVYSDVGHAEGKYTVVGSAVVDPETGETTYTGTGATFGHAEGYTSHAAGYTSHAEGYGTLAAGIHSHSEGYATQATGDGSHSEGYATIAAGGNSHAEGHTTFAQGLNSHASGHHTRANTANSTVIGRYNIADGTGTNDPKHLFIVGNGTADNARSNILEVSDSYLNVNGDIKQNGVSITSTPHTELTQAQYDALQSPDAGTEYFITDPDTSADVIANLEARVLALESSQTVYYVNGTQRVPLQLSNTYNVTKVNNNTVEWYVNEPTSNKNYKITVTASGAGNTRVNPRAVITEVSE